MTPAKRLLASIREYQRWMGKPGRAAELRRAAAVAQYKFWQHIAGADIPLETQIGGGLLLPHPIGVVIHSKAVIGPNCLIFQQVTLGTRDEEGPPVLGGHVDVGAGAKILGNIRIGDHAKIGANAVVLSDVPEGATAVGIPARIVLPRTISSPRRYPPPVNELKPATF
jgi:serine O-acetyltransferase